MIGQHDASCMNPIALPGTAGQDIAFWLVNLDTAAASGGPEAHGSVLDRREQERASRFRFERDARRFLASHAALRTILAQQTGRPARSLQFREGPFGKPHLEGTGQLHFNMSHSGGWALIGVSPAVPIGVDIELMNPMNDLDALAKRNFSQGEYAEFVDIEPDRKLQAFLRCWTRKEACLKALGSGLSIEPHLFQAGLGSEEARTTIPVNLQTCSMSVHPVDVPAPAIAACARLNATSAYLAM